MSATEGLTDAQVLERFGAIAERHGSKPVSCQCDQHQSRGGCKQPAAVVAECHLLHNCEGEEANEFGNRVELLCMSCVCHLWAEAQQIVVELRRAAQRTGRLPMCVSCQAPVVRPEDLLRSATPIPGGVR